MDDLFRQGFEELTDSVPDGPEWQEILSVRVDQDDAASRRWSPWAIAGAFAVTIVLVGFAALFAVDRWDAAPPTTQTGPVEISIADRPDGAGWETFEATYPISKGEGTSEVTEDWQGSIQNALFDDRQEAAYVIAEGPYVGAPFVQWQIRVLVDDPGTARDIGVVFWGLGKTWRQQTDATFNRFFTYAPADALVSVVINSRVSDLTWRAGTAADTEGVCVVFDTRGQAETLEHADVSTCERGDAAFTLSAPDLPATTTTADNTDEDAYWLMLEQQRQRRDFERATLGLRTGEIGCNVFHGADEWLIGPIPLGGSITVTDEPDRSIQVAATPEAMFSFTVVDDVGPYAADLDLQEAGIHEGAEFTVGAGEGRDIRTYASCWIER